MHDLVIRNGMVVDGTGEPGASVDVAVDGDRITEVGVVGAGRRTIDADGLLVTPGFIDIHTHYDAQSMWDAELASSSWHGVTTAVMGNCGVGFAPARTEDRLRLLELMEDVEDIPVEVLESGLAWLWEDFDEYLDAVDATPRAINVAAQLPHSALRLFVMGRRGLDGEQEPGVAELVQITDLVRDALDAGAVGVSTARTQAHKTRDGALLPTHCASDAELMAIAEGMRQSGRGVFEAAADRLGTTEEFARFREFAQHSGRPVSLPLVQSYDRPDEWRAVLDHIEAAEADGLHLSAQVAVRPVGQLLGFESSVHPFAECPSYLALAGASLEDLVIRLREPEVRAAIVGEADTPALRALCQTIFLFGDPVDYEPDAETSIACLAGREGTDPVSFAYDRMLERGGRTRLYRPSQNYADGTADAIAGMLASPATIPGLGDGGAHCTQICDVSFPISLLVHWGRDRARGELFAIEYLVAKQTRRPAELFGFVDRGLIAPGYKADINVIDFDHLALGVPEMRNDFPAGGQRLVQHASGYRFTLVSGEITVIDDEATGARPGRLVRSSGRAGDPSST